MFFNVPLFVLKGYSQILKPDPHVPNKNCIIYVIESPFKMIKNAFYFILKALFFLEVFNFCIMNFWSCRKNGLIRKIRIISKFMTSQPGYQTIEIHILPNISRRKSNQTMKPDQLIEYNKRKNFL